MTTYIAFCAASRLTKPTDFATAMRRAQRCLSTGPVGVVTVRRDSDELLVTPAMAELAGTDATNAASVDALYAEYG